MKRARQRGDHEATINSVRRPDEEDADKERQTKTMAYLS